ncbi:MAG TPA: GAF domain-containing sensor histidine kinase [Polyangiales bacterium]|nr:GAF domain-containing sensor histidine kinase [Polyangiales bacterium]
MSSHKLDGSPDVSETALPALGTISPILSEPPVVRLRRELELLIDVARAVNSSLDPDELFPNLMLRTTQLMRVERATLWLKDDARGVLNFKWSHGAGELPRECPLDEGVIGWVARNTQLVSLHDPHADERFSVSKEQGNGPRVRSLLCAPVRDKTGRCVGVVECVNKKTRGFDAEDELLMSCICVQCAVALDNGALYASLSDKHSALLDAESRLRSANGELEVLYAVEQQIASAEHVPSLIANVLERVVGLSQSDAAAVLLTRDATSQVFGSVRGQALPVRELDARETHLRLSQARFPTRRTGAPNDSLLNLPEFAAASTFTAPLSDGRTQIGLLQVLRQVDAGADEEARLGQLALVAGQLGRGIVLHRDRDAGERAQRLAILGHSVGGILHDMRTPLSAVGGYIELMASENSPEVRKDYAARVERALEHMESMTQEVLAFARGQREVLIRKVYLDKFIAEVRDMLVSEMSHFGVQLEVQVEYDGMARFDESKLKRVIWNLARNACEAMGQGGTFRWTIARTADHVVFECADTGPGIPKAMEGRLFESFATHGKASGTGLGLAMAKKIVDAHCGRISVSSPPGQGATFRIEIPS